MPKPTFASTLQQQLAAMNIQLVPGVPAGQNVANQLLLKNIEMLKMVIASLDVGIDWDTFEKWILPGATPTLIEAVQPGDIIVIKMTNYDVDNAAVVFYAQDRAVKPSNLDGLQFPVTNIVAGVNDALPFDEGGGPLTGIIAPGVYSDWATLAAAAAAAYTAAGNPLITYNVVGNDSTKRFTISSDKGVAGAAFNLRWGTGVATNAATELGFTATDVLDPNPVGPANPTSFTGTPVLFNIAGDDYLLVGYPLFAGDDETVVCEDDLYGILEATATLPVPITVRRSRIVVRNRG